MLGRVKLVLMSGALLAALLPRQATNAQHPSESWCPVPCGKVCKLVCEKKKLTAVGYGYKCETICIPSPSRLGCKHCDMTCCGEDEIDGCRPKIEFCWYDWFACGCAKPRTVRLLTKYQAEKELPSYHWEVVDAGCCDYVSQTGTTTVTDGSIYKAAPADAQLGDIVAVTEEEWQHLSPQFAPSQTSAPSQVAAQTSPGVIPLEPERKEGSVAERLQGLLRR
jgi:hypothetical protein